LARSIRNAHAQEANLRERLRWTGTVLLVATGLLPVSVGGCAFGPKVLEQTHGRYNESVRLVAEEELLLNLVHMRYNEATANLNVASIAAQYELSSQAEARPFFLAPNPSNSNVIFKTFTSILPDVSVSGANRPTMTLIPADDSDAARQFLTPIPEDTLIFLARTGWPVASVLRLWVERLNGVPNGGGRRDAVPDFARFLRIAELFQIAQDRQLMTVRSEDRWTEVGGPLPKEAITAAALVEASKNGLEYRPRAGGNLWSLMRRERRLVAEVTPGSEAAPEVAEMEVLLNLVPGRPRYDLVVRGGADPDPQLHPIPPSAELHVMARSTAQVYFYLSNGVEVPPEHLNCGVVRSPVDAEGRVFDGRALTSGLFEVHSSKGHRPPTTAYVAVKYRGYWYYIDDRDQDSKATFALVLQLSRLDFGRFSPRPGPVLTLPAGR
jgi:hypothetical protein